MKIGQSLQINNVSKFYGKFQALNEVELTANSGEFITILGSSGSGKTTLLKIIAGFEENSSGSILINGANIEGKKSYERNIGMLFQNYALFPHMTIEENIAYPLKLRKVPKVEIKERVSNMIALVKLNGMEKRYPSQLSGGQQQRVALARAIVYNPPLLLLDEPLGALDKNLRHEMQFEIKRIQKELGITTISVTHDQEEALTMSDKICIMSFGEVQQIATPEEIYSRPKNKFVAEFMGTNNILNYTVSSYKGVKNDLILKGKSEISDDEYQLKISSQGLEEIRDQHLIAVRPENIHVAKDGEKYINTFKATVLQTVYLGDGVNLKVAAKQKEINIKLSMEEYRLIEGRKNAIFYFNTDMVSVLYGEKIGKRLLDEMCV